jgi:predicted nucleic acid-binding protein
VATVFYLDASALAKRYVPETGSAQMDAILDAIPPRRLFILNIGAGEVVSIFVRKRNAGLIAAADFGQAYADFENQVLHGANVEKISATNRLVFSSLALIGKHSINANDAVMLRSALTVARRLRRTGDDLVLVASDQRLLRAAEAEGLSTFDPERQDLAALAVFLGP